MKRKFIAVYFPHIDENKNRITKNVSIAFNNDEMSLYNKVKSLTAKEIKKSIGIFSYNQLCFTAEKENRKITEIIKMRLSEKLLHNTKRINRSVDVNPSTVKKWIKELKKNENNRVYLKIADFLKDIID